MTVYAPRITKQQEMQAIWGWTNGSWTPGITFLAGPTSQRPSQPPDMTLYYNTDTSTLDQYHNGWSNLNSPGNEVPVRSGSDPNNPSLGDFVNRYDLGVIKQCTNTTGPVWTSMGSNQIGLPTGTLYNTFLQDNGCSGLSFTDTDKTLSANLYLVLSTPDGSTFDPLLATDQGLVVKKDISAGGMLASNQGVLALGNGFNNATDPPMIWLTHNQGFGTQDTLYLKQFDLQTPAHLNLGNLTATSVPATSTTTTVNSPYFDLEGASWSGTASVPCGFREYAAVTAPGSFPTDPTAHISWNLNNNGIITELMTLDQSSNLWLGRNLTAAGDVTCSNIVSSTGVLMIKASLGIVIGSPNTMFVTFQTSPGNPVAVHNGNILDDGSGNMTLLGKLSMPSSLAQTAQINFGNFNAGQVWMGFPNTCYTLQFKDVSNTGWQFYIADTSTQVLAFTTGGAARTKNNTLDDGSGNMTVIGNGYFGSQAQIVLFYGGTAVNGNGGWAGISIGGRPRIGDWGNWLVIGEPNGTHGGGAIQVTGYGQLYTGTTTSLTTFTVRNTLDDGSGKVTISSFASGSSRLLYLNTSSGSGTLSVSSSSIRYKENVETIADASWIYNLRPVNFTWKDPSRAEIEGTQMGLIAEEVYAQYPRLTWLDDGGQPDGVHYEWLGVPLIVELQKLKQRVDQLENQLKQSQPAA